MRDFDVQIRAHIGNGRHIIFKAEDHLLIFAACTNEHYFKLAYHQIHGEDPTAALYLNYMARRPELKAIAAETMLNDGTTLEQELKGRMGI